VYTSDSQARTRRSKVKVGGTIEWRENVVSISSDNAQQDSLGTASGRGGGGHGKRRWYHPRPNPRFRADLAGFNWTYWLFIVFLVLLFFL
jgi:hypothetical protein